MGKVLIIRNDIHRIVKFEDLCIGEFFLHPVSREICIKIGYNDRENTVVFPGKTALSLTDDTDVFDTDVRIVVDKGVTKNE